jgi:hypothetical protein
MPARRTARKAAAVTFAQRWRSALAEAGLTQRAWATSRGLSDQHVSEVAKGKRQSSALVAEMHLFVDAQEEAMRRRLAQGAAA